MPLKVFDTDTIYCCQNLLGIKYIVTDDDADAEIQCDNCTAKDFYYY